MKKAFFEFVIIVFIFLSGWFLLSKIDWMSVLQVKKVTDKTEERLGNLFWSVFTKDDPEIDSKKVLNPMDSLINELCSKNKIDRKKIKLHVVRKDEINAFTLPDNHLVVYTGLLEECENEEEFCGVLCHEMAHMENHHVMNKLVKEYGLTVLVSVSTGSGNSNVIKEAVKKLSSTAYDRKLESEADLKAADYMMKAGMDPEALANFLYRLSNKNKLPEQLYWISTHPESKERSNKILDYIKNKTYSKIKILGDSRWASLKESIKEE